MCKSGLQIHNPLALRLLLDGSEPGVKVRIDNAIDALALASKDGGELDKPCYKQAHAGLVDLREAALSIPSDEAGGEEYDGRI